MCETLQTICVAGKNDIAVNVLEEILSKNLPNVRLVVTCNRTEDGCNDWQRSLRYFAALYGVEEITLDEAQATEGLVFLSMEYDRLVKPELFRSGRLFNIHFSKLPAYKGMYTSALPILNGETVVGVTLHEIDAGIDTGRIIAQDTFALLEEDSSRDLYRKYIEHGSKLVISYLDDILDGTYAARPQPCRGSTYYSKAAIDYSDVRLDLNRTACEIGRQVRAFTFREFQLPAVLGYDIFDYEITADRSHSRPGTLISDDAISLRLATVDYDILLYKDRFADLMHYCATGDLEGVRSIHGVGCYLDQYDDHGWTPLIVATYNNKVAIVEYLLVQGADPRQRNFKGTNLLMYAKDAYINTGDDRLLKLFMEHGVSPCEQDYSGRSLLDYLSSEKYGEHVLRIVESEFCSRSEGL
ncbi:formyltransferase family protein [Adlercreutzia sp. ZJ141]|uniref:formyltransferase family protein n=1 Tax=Adlercreutzia sp. ZJ141 TaxID=2709406 RepID=UPI0013ED617F|nr:formyltransferase family protein [Adlercreutzia sp. ZJ141]